MELNIDPSDVAGIVRHYSDEAHAHALTHPGVVDGIYLIEALGVRLGEFFEAAAIRAGEDFDKQEFLSLAIDVPGVRNAWDSQ